MSWKLQFVFLLTLAWYSIPLAYGINRQIETGYNALIFQSEANLYLFDLKKEHLVHLASGVQFFQVAASERYVVWKTQDGLYVSPIDSVQPSQIVTGDQEIYSASWSPDDHRLAYITEPINGHCQSALHIWDIETFTDTIISQYTPQRMCYSGITWSPDGEYILFRARNGIDDLGSSSSVYFDVYMISKDRNNLVNLTNGMGNIESFYLSPDGSHILLTSDQENRDETERMKDYMHNFQVFLLDLQSKKSIQVMSMVMGRQELALFWTASPWSPKNDWVLLPPSDVQPDTLRAVNVDGTLHHQVVNTWFTNQRQPGFRATSPIKLAPDGKLVAGGGWAEAEGKEGLCIVGIDGKHFRAAVPGIFVTDLYWSPDSQSLFFEYTTKEFGKTYQYGIVNVDGDGFYNPFANLTEKPFISSKVSWIRLSDSMPATSRTNTYTAIPAYTSTPVVIKNISTPTLIAVTATSGLQERATPTNILVPTPAPMPNNGRCAVSSAALVTVAVLLWQLLRQRSQ